MDAQASRALSAGAVSATVGLLLFAVSLTFLADHDTPEEIVGVFVPLTVGQLMLGLGVLAALPAVLGDVPRTGRIMAWTLRGIVVAGLAIDVAGAVAGELPWIAFAILPLLTAVPLLRDSVRLLRSHPADSSDQPAT